MMPSLINTNMLGVSHIPSAGYATDSVLDELSRQLHSINTRRHSKNLAYSQRSGTAMRVSKPGSANNSPRSTMMQSRRRTLVGDGLQAGPHQQPADTSYLPTPASEVPQERVCERDSRPARPVSWHPTSYQLAQSQYLQEPSTSCTFPQYTDNDTFASYQKLPPTPTAYSAYTSPSAFSPLSLACSNNSSQQYFSPAHQPQSTQQASTFPPTQSPSNSIGASSELSYLPEPKVVGGSLDWESFTAHGFNRCSAPPTPEDFLQASKPEAKLATEDTIPYQPLEDDESEGEILYGMGLYDVPDKNPPLDFHRSTVFSLLGSAGSYPEPTGKGLKLEDAWEPPASDDEEDENDDEDDAEGDDD